jgi:phenylacetate-CoA ligase
MAPELAQSGHDAREAAAAKLEHSIKGYIGVSSNVQLALPGGIERSIGKAKRVVDRRPRQ